MTDVVLVVPPFADLNGPAIGVSLLEAAAKGAGFSCVIDYAALSFAAEIGAGSYRRLVDVVPSHELLGERVFADLLFAGRIPELGSYAAEFVSRYDATREVEAALRIAVDGAGAFVEAAARRILALRPRVVGFSTSFHQTCASLAIARRLKSEAAAPSIVFGGANCEGEMGIQLLRSFPWIDFVANGEADGGFVDWLRWLLRGEGALPAGFASRDAPVASAPRRLEMDALPIPDYGDYFAALEASPIRGAVTVRLPIETARGCWWGARHHCTFCGLNGASMAFRSKTAERALFEFRLLPTRYGVRALNGVDNILDLRYLKTVVPALAETDPPLDIFYEVKANLRLDQLRLLAKAGIRGLQPGIESLSDEVLDLMRKGCSAAQNVQLLRWGKELGIELHYNLLYGFPRESDAAYDEMLSLLPLLHHLQPPEACGPVRLDRFSPFFEDPASFGIARVRPARAFYYVFPLPRSDLASLAYCFDFDYEQLPAGLRRAEDVRKAVAGWLDQGSAVLDAVWQRESCTIIDTRRVATAPAHRLQGLDARVLFACDTGRTAESLSRALSVSPAAVEASLRKLCELKLVTGQRRRFFTVAVFRDREAFLHAERTNDGPEPAAHPHRLAVLG
jgi:ribosomal peptide maturation radical SAM protein 1